MHVVAPAINSPTDETDLRAVNEDLSRGSAADRIKIFFGSLPQYYDFQYAENVESNDLVVVLSAYNKIHKLINNETCNVLYFSDSSSSYYFRSIHAVVEALTKFIDYHEFKNVALLGASKAGYSAILLASLLAKAEPERRYSCVTFSPHTRLWPLNEGLMRFKSYDFFVHKARSHPGSMLMLERFGNLKGVQRRPNLFLTIVYSEKHAVDRDEARYLTGPQVRHVPIPFQFHSSIVPFLIRGQPLARRERLCRVLYEQLLAQDADVRDKLPTSPESFFRLIERADRIPPIHDFIAGCMTWTPNPARNDPARDHRALHAVAAAKA